MPDAYLALSDLIATVKTIDEIVNFFRGSKNPPVPSDFTMYNSMPQQPVEEAHSRVKTNSQGYYCVYLFAMPWAR